MKPAFAQYVKGKGNGIACGLVLPFFLMFILLL